jgi:hypothetical protein
MVIASPWPSRWLCSCDPARFEGETPVKTLIAILVSFAVLAPSLAEAGSSKKTKVTTCSSYTYITGTTKTSCRKI